MIRTIIATSGILLVGCTSTEYDDFQDAPDHLLFTQEKYATIDEIIAPEDLKKGPFPPGRVIDYKGHGLGYQGHADHHRHLYGHSPH